MSCIRPATPGFLVTLIATALLAVVTFSVPYFKSVYFLKASLSQEGIDGAITFGTLGYCLTLNNGTACSKPAIGYQLDINALVGNKLPVKIPDVLVKWVTYALFLHAVALILAAVSAIFGLLAHVREISMACCSTCVSGFSAAVCLIAFIFDLVLFFIAKARINAIPGASASIGIGIWLTLAAWILLFFAGCFYGFGRCCISRRPKRDTEATRDDPYTERLRLDAVKAEADRKARQKQGETGLPAFQEYEQTQPLTKQDHDEYVDDGDQIVPLHSVAGGAYGRQGVTPARQPSSGHPPSVPYVPGGYAQAAPGNRTVDDYYNVQQNSYPPRPSRQASGHTQDSSYRASSPPVPPIPAPARSPTDSNAQYLAAGAAYGHGQYPSQNYGHTAGGTTYHSATSHQQYPSSYSNQYDPYASNQTFNPDAYNATGYMTAPTNSFPDHNAYYAQSTYPTTAPQAQPERSYTLGGDGYGSNTIPDLTGQTGHYAAAPYPTYGSPSPVSAHQTHSPAPISTNVASPSPHAQSPTSPRGPRQPTSAAEQPYPDSPPMYDMATSQPAGQWGAKR
ncbi:pali-domain-containing protein [Cristinia sonorae]|uniref:Pali-domain-containing protein n=1 Tax=Cristinia sonorae TaxID=1940300 RepID=A0A8K0UM52_9AGAR|nr:pali-domain-containing protein [Cristinia sonorae]